MASVWDFCVLDAAQLELMHEIEKSLGKSFDSCPSSSGALSVSRQLAMETNNMIPVSQTGIDGLQNALLGAESSCADFMNELDDILKTLGEISGSHADVTGRTNNLMLNCENLLEQQHTLQATVEVLKTTLAPLNDVEEVSGLLGIPVDARGKPTGHSTAADTGSNIDPRSPEFHEVLARLARALAFMKEHREFRDSEQYQRWLEQLQNRATSLVARSMRELLDNAAKSCADNMMKQAARPKSDKAEELPLESAPLYQKFRGLGFRMRELSALLKGSGGAVGGLKSQRAAGVSGKSAGLSNTGTAGHNIDQPQQQQDVLQDVKQAYVLLRSELLVPFVRDSCLSTLQSAAAKVKASASTGSLNGDKPSPRNKDISNSNSTSATAPASQPQTATLCPGIRHSFNTLLRVTQLEQQLFDSLFKAPLSSNDDAAATSGTMVSPRSPRSMTTGTTTDDSSNGGSANANAEVFSIIESVCNAVGDLLRPLIIRESDVDELCRVVTTLAEDVKSQITAVGVHRSILKRLLRALDRTVSDAQERLSYCAETRLRLDVELFEPLPSQLAYPDILEGFASRKTNNSNSGKGATATAKDAVSNTSASADGTIMSEDVSSTWYPPLRRTLALLSKLYGVVEMVVFEDFARRSVALCVQSLRSGAEGVKRTRSQLHGDFFLVRHLLILREQLLPFEIKLQSVERVLDFAPTGAALTHLFASSSARNLLRFDTANGIFQLARDGIPGLQELSVDAKKDLDAVLKASCGGMKTSAVKMLLGPIDAFLAKVTAFVGEIPTTVSTHAQTQANTLAAGEGAAVPLLPPETRALIKNQAFMRAERIKEVLLSVQETAVQAAPELRDIMKLYVENSVARTILLKPVQQEVEVAHKRMECVIASCLDHGQPRRDVEQLLRSIISTVMSELSH